MQLSSLAFIAITERYCMNHNYSLANYFAQVIHIVKDDVIFHLQTVKRTFRISANHSLYA